MRLGSLLLLLSLIGLTLFIFGSIETMRIAPLIAKVTDLKGEAIAVIKPKFGQEQKVERNLKVGSLVLAGTTIRTGKESFVVLKWVDELEMRIGPETELKVTRSSFNKATKAIEALFRLNLGTVFVKLKQKLTSPSRLELETPAITAAVRGTAYKVKVEPNRLTTLQVEHGQVLIKLAKNKELLLKAGQKIVAEPEGNFSVDGYPENP
ncbi:MAG: FecR family protein [Armatimonadetes bacterium]|nr:FecR family protein [Armatimonadota bacterium]MDW8027797.1 FecR family protein [Armatimonadota bacterium]